MAHPPLGAHAVITIEEICGDCPDAARHIQHSTSVRAGLSRTVASRFVLVLWDAPYGVPYGRYGAPAGRQYSAMTHYGKDILPLAGFTAMLGHGANGDSNGNNSQEMLDHRGWRGA